MSAFGPDPAHPSENESGPSPAPAPAPALRASDSDRERTVEVLRHATGDGRLGLDELDGRLELVYASRTVAELEALTADLQAPAANHSANSDGVIVREGAPGGTRRVLSIMGGHSHRGRWRVAPKCTVINIMGGSEIDLTKAELSSRQTRINVLALMGGCEMYVPAGVDVQVSKLGIMGGNDIRLGDTPPAPGSPTIHIRLLSIMGGCSVIEGPKKTREQRRLERDRRRYPQELSGRQPPE